VQPIGRHALLVERIAHDEASIRRLVGRLGDPRRLRACYEAGPTGYELARLLDRMGIGSRPTRATVAGWPGCTGPGSWWPSASPTPAEEAVRDLCRTRADMVEDLTRARNRLGKFLLRHGRVWRGGSAWTHKHEAWLGGQRFDEPALGTTYAHYRAVVATRHAQLDAVEVDLATWLDRPPFADQVARLAAYRGVTRLGGLTLAAEVGDWRRFARAAQFMGFCGLVPSEYSSGHSVHRGRLTKAGNAHLRAQLVESAWTYRHRPYVGRAIAGRQLGLDPEVVARAWAAQLRLSARFRALVFRP
jgi:transposase